MDVLKQASCENVTRATGVGRFCVNFQATVNARTGTVPRDCAWRRFEQIGNVPVVISPAHGRPLPTCTGGWSTKRTNIREARRRDPGLRFASG
jgi:hypothetical protein